MAHKLKIWAMSQEDDLELADLAEQIGCSPSMLSHYLAGRRRPTLEAIAKIAEVTGGTVTARDWWTTTDSWQVGTGEHFAEVRKVLGMHAQDVAGAAGLVINTYKLIEAGARKPTIAQLFAICRALGTTPSKALAAGGA